MSDMKRYESDTDTRIAKLYEDLASTQNRLSQSVIALHRSAGHTGKHLGHGRYQWSGTLSEALASGRPEAIVAYAAAERAVEAARETLKEANALKRYIVKDEETGRTGILVESPGYVLNGSYVNKTLRIVWDEEWEDEG